MECGETFGPMVRPTIIISTILCLAISRKWSIHQLDVKNAFLHGHLQEIVYMHQPPDFVHPDKPKHVSLLRKSLYGLKQSPRARYWRFASYILSFGL